MVVNLNYICLQQYSTYLRVLRLRVDLRLRMSDYTWLNYVDVHNNDGNVLFENLIQNDKKLRWVFNYNPILNGTGIKTENLCKCDFYMKTQLKHRQSVLLPKNKTKILSFLISTRRINSSFIQYK